MERNNHQEFRDNGFFLCIAILAAVGIAYAFAFTLFANQTNDRLLRVERIVSMDVCK